MPGSAAQLPPRPPGWTVVRDVAFSVEMPGPAVKTERQWQGQRIALYTSGTKRHELYQAGIFPRGASGQKDESKALTEMALGANTKEVCNGKLVDAKIYTYDWGKMISFTFACADGQPLQGQVRLMNGAFYALMVKMSDPPDASGFLRFVGTFAVAHK